MEYEIGELDIQSSRQVTIEKICWEVEDEWSYSEEEYHKT